MIKIAPYGSWKSPITADLTASSSIRIGDLQIYGDKVYWSEMRPDEQGRNVVMEYSDKGINNFSPSGFNIRTTVHEYGGCAYTVIDDTLYFSNFKDQLLYSYEKNKSPHKITNNTDYRHADYFSDVKRNSLVCIREDHSDKTREAINSIVSINLDDESSKTLVEGNDFYSDPRLNPEGSLMAFLTWNHPIMPWDGCELWLAEIGKDGSVGKMNVISGGVNESIVQPDWSPSGVLYFVSDKDGWWNLYRVRGNSVESVYPMDAEFGGPHWVFGLSYYDFESARALRGF